MARPIPVADKAVAQAALTDLMAAAVTNVTSYPDREQGAWLAAELIGFASKVRFQPSTRQLVLTFDLAMGSDTPE